MPSKKRSPPALIWDPTFLNICCIIDQFKNQVKQAKLLGAPSLPCFPCMDRRRPNPKGVWEMCLVTITCHGTHRLSAQSQKTAKGPLDFHISRYGQEDAHSEGCMIRGRRLTRALWEATTGQGCLAPSLLSPLFCIFENFSCFFLAADVLYSWGRHTAIECHTTLAPAPAVSQRNPLYLTETSCITRQLRDSIFLIKLLEYVNPRPLLLSPPYC